MLAHCFIIFSGLIYEFSIEVYNVWPTRFVNYIGLYLFPLLFPGVIHLKAQFIELYMYCYMELGAIIMIDLSVANIVMRSVASGIP